MDGVNEALLAAHASHMNFLAAADAAGWGGGRGTNPAPPANEGEWAAASDDGWGQSNQGEWAVGSDDGSGHSKQGEWAGWDDDWEHATQDEDDGSGHANQGEWAGWDDGWEHAIQDEGAAGSAYGWGHATQDEGAAGSAYVSEQSIKRELRSPERPPLWKKPRREVSETELNDLRAERAAAKELNLKWQERGPPGAPGEKWRGQNYRVNTGKWANRGGANKAWYNAYYAAKKGGPEALELFLKFNPHPNKANSQSQSSHQTYEAKSETYHSESEFVPKSEDE